MISFAGSKWGTLHRNLPLITFLDPDEVVGAPRGYITLRRPEPYGTELEGSGVTERILNSDYTEDRIILTRRTPCFLFSERVSRLMWKRWRI